RVAAADDAAHEEQIGVRIGVVVQHSAARRRGAHDRRRRGGGEIDAQLGVAEGGPGVVGRPRRVVDGGDVNGEGDGGGGVGAAIGRAAVVVQRHRDGGVAVRVRRRGKGQHAARRDGRLRGEEGVVVVRNGEVDALRRLVGRAGG